MFTISSGKLFSALFIDMGAEYLVLMFFVKPSVHHLEGKLFQGHLLVMKLSYLVHKFDKLTILNLQFEGTNSHVLNMSDKVNAFL